MAPRHAATRREFITLAAAAGVAAAAPRSGQAQSAPAPGRTPPLLDDVDVLVVGGGSAGFGAALGAARKGVNTLLIENHAFFGGVASWSLGMQINQVRPDGKPRSVVHELLVHKLQALGEQAVRFGTHELWCNVEYLKVAMLDALDEVRCRYLVHLRAADALVENNRITGVIVATKQGLRTIRAKAVIDCTGDADVAFCAGAETLIDPDALMPMTLALALSNIDRTKVTYNDVAEAMRKGRAKYPLIPKGFFEIKRIAHSANWYINHSGTADLGRVDATDPLQRSKAECTSRRQALQMVQAIRESTKPDVARIEWAAGGPQVSVRETRRVKGAYILTEQDAMEGSTFDDVIAWRSGYVDLGGQRGGKFVKMKVHDVPYRAILPEKLEGLLTAGRCISATHVAAAAGKSMGNCMATGHAAGVAAALAVQKKILPRDVPVRDLQEALRADGVDLNVKDREQKGL